MVHGGGWFVLQVDARPDVVRVEVTDANAARPRLPRAAGDRDHGRGPAIVNALAARWGTEHVGARTLVWFELVAPARGGTGARRRAGA